MYTRILYHHHHVRTYVGLLAHVCILILVENHECILKHLDYSETQFTVYFTVCLVLTIAVMVGWVTITAWVRTQSKSHFNDVMFIFEAFDF